MIRVNEDPHKEGYRLEPTYHLTAVFEKCEDMVEITQALQYAGFSEEQVDVLAGEEGAKQLDFKGDHHGFFARMKRRVQMIIGDESDNLRKIEMTLNRGGMAIFIAIDNDDDLKHRTLEVLKPYDPSEVCYWGNLAIERLWVRQSNVPVPAHGVSPTSDAEI